MNLNNQRLTSLGNQASPTDKTVQSPPKNPKNSSTRNFEGSQETPKYFHPSFNNPNWNATQTLNQSDKKNKTNTRNLQSKDN